MKRQKAGVSPDEREPSWLNGARSEAGRQTPRPRLLIGLWTIDGAHFLQALSGRTTIGLQFVPIEVKPTATAAPFELVLGGGRIVRVPFGFDAAALTRLLSVLEGRAW